ncbi:hypothetical protein D9M71_478260 [compost metagenome]
MAALLVQQHFQLGGVVAAVALDGRLHQGGAQARQVALVFGDQARRVGQAAFQLIQLLVAGAHGLQQLEGMFEAGLERLQLGFGELAVGKAVKALLDLLGGRQIGIGRHGGQAGEGPAEENDGKEKTQQEWHGRVQRLSGR